MVKCREAGGMFGGVVIRWNVVMYIVCVKDGMCQICCAGSMQREK